MDYDVTGKSLRKWEFREELGVLTRSYFMTDEAKADPEALATQCRIIERLLEESEAKNANLRKENDVLLTKISALERRIIEIAGDGEKPLPALNPRTMPVSHVRRMVVEKSVELDTESLAALKEKRALDLERSPEETASVAQLSAQKKKLEKDLGVLRQSLVIANKSQIASGRMMDDLQSAYLALLRRVSHTSSSAEPDRDGSFAAGMEAGYKEAYERLQQMYTLCPPAISTGCVSDVDPPPVTARPAVHDPAPSAPESAPDFDVAYEVLRFGYRRGIEGVEKTQMAFAPKRLRRYQPNAELSAKARKLLKEGIASAEASGRSLPPLPDDVDVILG